MPEPLLDEAALEAAADELICTDGEPYLGSDEARAGWARSIIVAYFAALDRGDITDGAVRVGVCPECGEADCEDERRIYELYVPLSNLAALGLSPPDTEEPT